MAQLKIQKPQWIDAFRSFILRGNVVDLAVGVVIGAAFTGIVNSLVKDIFTPVIGFIVGGVDFTNIFVTLKGTPAATLEQAQKAGAVTLNVGLFLNACLNFLIIAFALFWVLRFVNSLVRKAEKAQAPTATELLLVEIRDELRAKRPH